MQGPRGDSAMFYPDSPCDPQVLPSVMRPSGRTATSHIASSCWLSSSIGPHAKALRTQKPCRSFRSVTWRALWSTVLTTSQAALLPSSKKADACLFAQLRKCATMTRGEEPARSLDSRPLFSPPLPFSRFRNYESETPATWRFGIGYSYRLWDRALPVSSQTRSLLNFRFDKNALLFWLKTKLRG